MSDSGKKVVNVLLCDKEEMLMRVTRVVLKAQQGDQGVKAGLLFLFDCKDPKEKGLLEKFSQYDTWTSEDYQKFHEERYSDVCCERAVIAIGHNIISLVQG